MDLGIKGRKAFITGADSGIGWHTARLLLAEGVIVVATDLHPEKLDAASKFKAADGQLHAFAADITDLDSLANLASQVQAAVGDIDILIQSAGITGARGLFHEIDDAG